MANDPSMPPSEQNPGTPVDNSPAMAAPAPSGPAAPSAPEGNVMISMPKQVFDAMHGIVVQLAMTLDKLRGTVEQGPQGAAAPMAAPAAAASAPSPAEGQPESETDEDFLKGLAEEGNQR